MTTSIEIYTDGASRNNPGQAAIGVVINDKHGHTIGEISRCIGIATNNQAEYRAVIAGLEMATRLGAGQIELKTDSELVARQLSGRYRVKNAGIKPLHQKCVQLLGGFEKYTITSIARRLNTRADSLANQALDGRSS